MELFITFYLNCMLKTKKKINKNFNFVMRNVLFCFNVDYLDYHPFAVHKSSNLVANLTTHFFKHINIPWTLNNFHKSKTNNKLVVIFAFLFDCWLNNRSLICNCSIKITFVSILLSFLKNKSIICNFPIPSISMSAAIFVICHKLCLWRMHKNHN